MCGNCLEKFGVIDIQYKNKLNLSVIILILQIFDFYELINIQVFFSTF